MTTPPENNEEERHYSVTSMKQSVKILENSKKLKVRLPMRIPESLRAIGTEGFKISSLQNPARKSKPNKHSPIEETELHLFFHYQILIMFSLSSFLRLIFACIVAAILSNTDTQHDRKHQNTTRDPQIAMNTTICLSYRFRKRTVKQDTSTTSTSPPK